MRLSLRLFQGQGWWSQPGIVRSHCEGNTADFPSFFCELAKAVHRMGDGSMQQYFTRDYMFLWTALLTVALFFPVRHLIWGMSVNRAARLGSGIDDTLRRRLRRRAAVTAALLSYIFSLVYTFVLFHGRP